MPSSSKPRPAASSSGDLPADALYEVLLRIPAKELCRLRAVCPAWRALTSEPLFVAAHKSRHRTAPPLLAMGYRDEDSGVSGVEISDLSGNVVKRIPCTEYALVVVDESGDAIGRIKDDKICVVPTRLDLICFNRNVVSASLWVMNPATGATIHLPIRFSEELVHELEVKGIKVWYCRDESCAFGQVSSSREYKALRISVVHDRKVCEVITFSDTSHGSWRRKQDPPSQNCTSDKNRCAVVDGVVYYLMDICSSDFQTGGIAIEEPGSVASFNLDTEEWMGVLPGPEQLKRFVQQNQDYSYFELQLDLSLAELNGCLVLVHNVQNISLDLWFLTDFEKGIWVKKYNMPSHVARPFRYPFLMLDDGRIFFRGMGSLQSSFTGGERGEGGFMLSYDPRTDTYGDAVKLRDPKSFGIYTGSLLSL